MGSDTLICDNLKASIEKAERYMLLASRRRGEQRVTTKFELQNFVTVQYIGHLRREPKDCHDSPDPG